MRSSDPALLQTIIDELVKKGMTEKAVRSAINILVKREEFALQKQGKVAKRLR